MKRLLVISDTHCGHMFGLTPPQYEMASDYGLDFPQHQSAQKIRRRMWDWYSGLMDELKPDILIHNGDAIDGKGERSGGIELITADRNVQIQMATECIKAAGAKIIRMTHGTPYHSGKGEEWETTICNLLKSEGLDARVEDQLYLEIEGVMFSIRHHLSRSTVPHGRQTPLAKEQVWNALMAERGKVPKARVIIRSHAHYYCYNGDANCIGVATPALQISTKYGEQRCVGDTDIGLVWFDLNGDGCDPWPHHEIFRDEALFPRVEVLTS